MLLVLNVIGGIIIIAQNVTMYQFSIGNLRQTPAYVSNIIINSEQILFAQVFFFN